MSGFSPLVSISTLQAALKTETGTKRIASMVKRAKVPIWTMKEIIEPCYNEPIEIMIKELTAKINRELIGYSLADEVVDQLVNKVRSEGTENKLSYMDVYELGFSNNQRAIEPLT